MRREWVLACAAAEAIGMAASAGAASWAGDLPTAAALSVVVAGGLVEGAALGVLQARVIARLLPGLRRTAWVVATVLVAGVGWSLGSLPSVLSSSKESAASPWLPLVLLGAAALGLVMGAVLGSAQALTLRGVAAAPARWVLANALAWSPAMAVIFLGTSVAEETWTPVQVVLLGAATGAAAGAVLGVVTGAFLPDPPTGSGMSDPCRKVDVSQLKRG